LKTGVLNISDHAITGLALSVHSAVFGRVAVVFPKRTDILERQNQRRARKAAAVIVAIMAVILIYDRIWILHHGRGSEHWPQVAGQVEHFESVLKGGGRAQPSWRLSLRYRYVVAGTEYQGERIRFSRALQRRGADQARLDEARYAQGNEIQVRYHPDHPELSVLESGVGRNAWLGLGLGIVMLLISVIFWTVPTRVVKQGKL